MAGACGSIARDWIVRFVKPEFAALQLAPPSRLLKMPASVPAYRVEGVSEAMAMAEILPPKGPTAVHSFTPEWEGVEIKRNRITAGRTKKIFLIIFIFPPSFLPFGEEKPVNWTRVIKNGSSPIYSERLK